MTVPVSHETVDLRIRRRKTGSYGHRRDEHQQLRESRTYHAGTDNQAHNTPFSRIYVRFQSTARRDKDGLRNASDLAPAQTDSLVLYRFCGVLP